MGPGLEVRAGWAAVSPKGFGAEWRFRCRGQGSATLECLSLGGGGNAVPEVLVELSPRMKEKNGREQGLSAPPKEAGWLSVPWLVTGVHRKDLAGQEQLGLVEREEESHGRMLVPAGATQGPGALTPRTAQPRAPQLGHPVSILCSGPHGHTCIKRPGM